MTIVASPGSIARFRVQAVDLFVYRVACEPPVQTSFGIMTERPAVFVRVRDDDGQEGWGEIWCNFPICGAEHRARLAQTVLLPLLQGRWVDDVAATTQDLRARTAVLALQAGEPGPLAQAIAGLDIALWDLAARRAGVPLYRLLGGSSGRVAAYASGINPVDSVGTALRARSQGHAAFKLKVGFDTRRDIANVAALREALGPSVPLMVDANQAWSLNQALDITAQLVPHGLDWVEEPLRVDAPEDDWARLAAACPIPLSGGENLDSQARFEAAIARGHLRVLQPDVAKWGGVSGCLAVARQALAAGRRYCPHYLGAGIGLAASAHVLAAVGGDGMLEIDVNANPLRSWTAGAAGRVADGAVQLDPTPGLGVLPDLKALEPFRVPMQKHAIPEVA